MYQSSETRPRPSQASKIIFLVTIVNVIRLTLLIIFAKNIIADVSRALTRPGRFPEIAGSSETHGNDRKFHKSYEIINQTKIKINKLCLG